MSIMTWLPAWASLFTFGVAMFAVQGDGRWVSFLFVAVGLWGIFIWEKLKERRG